MVDVEARVLTELHGLRRRHAEVSGVVLATVDGMLVASDLPGVDPDPIAALAATSFGLGRQFVHTLCYGAVRESVIYTSTGLIVIYPAGTSCLLTVLAEPDIDPDRLHADARVVADRIGLLRDEAHIHRWPMSTPTSGDRCAPRPRRLPTPMSPATLPTRRAIMRPPGRP